MLIKGPDDDVDDDTSRESLLIKAAKSFQITLL